MANVKINELRECINKIDKQIAQLFEQRMKVVKDIAEYKREHDLPIKDELREYELKTKLVAEIKDIQLKKYYVRYLDSMIKISCDYQSSIY